MFVDAYYDRQKDIIKVSERSKDGERILKEYPAEHVAYYVHPQGSYKSIFGDPLKKFSTNDSKKFRKEMSRLYDKKIFESDINPVFRALADHYRGADSPKLNVIMFDIECGWHQKHGFAPASDPFNEITAISVHLSWVDKLITLALCPPTMTLEEAERQTKHFDDTFIFDDEKELLKVFLEVIEDGDVLSGWNSLAFDVPYTINRITRILGKEYTRSFCLWNELPREREYIEYKKKNKTYDLVGRSALDYMQLFKKHNPQQLHSYRLDFVGEMIVGENKILYDGTLDQLWKQDFAKFVEYNRQDTLLLHKIDQKKQFIDLANQVAHSICVPLKTTMGSVALVEQAIINEMHEMGFIVPNRPPKDWSENEEEDDDDDDDEEDDHVGIFVKETKPVCGAYVAQPKVGMHSHIGCIDVSSMYPSAIRSLNMSPETIYAQLRPIETDDYIEKKAAKLPKNKKAEAWEGIFATFEYEHVAKKDGEPITIDFEDGTTKQMSARDVHAWIFNPNNHICVTANGTIFKTDKPGIIPMLLAKWYSERKEMQAKQTEYEAIEDNLKKTSNDKEEIAEIHEKVVFWKQRQQSRKILLNSLYGALLNEGLRFHDARLGQSTTLTGRMIVRHMTSKTEETITGNYDYTGSSMVYNDTDSMFFSAYESLVNNDDFKDFDWTRENIIELYRGITDLTNDSFAGFMDKSFNTGFDRGAIIKAGLELVASRGLFIKKKKYAALMYYKDGFRLDTNGSLGEKKITGLDIRRSDTPRVMQIFLEKVLMDVLTDRSQEEIFEEIKQFRKDFKTRPGYEKGSPRTLKAMSVYVEANDTIQKRNVTDRIRKGEKSKIQIPSHVRAGMNWNKLCEVHGDRFSMRIGDGSKVIVCKLKSNTMGIERVAYPVDESHLPKWFKELPFDHEEMESVIIDKKLNNLVGVLKWDLTKTRERPADDFFVFN